MHFTGAAFFLPSVLFSLLHLLDFFLGGPGQGIGVESRGGGQLDFDAVYLFTAGLSLGHAQVKDMAALGPVRRDKMQVPAACIYALHVVGVINAYQAALYVFKAEILLLSVKHFLKGNMVAVHAAFAPGRQQVKIAVDADYMHAVQAEVFLNLKIQLLLKGIDGSDICK